MSLKMVIAVRTDLDMGKGKIAGQVAHAAVALTINQQSVIIKDWYENHNQTKVVVRVGSLEELLTLKKTVDDTGIFNIIIHDLGKTQIDANTATCIGIGPAESDVIDTLTKHLRLL